MELNVLVVEDNKAQRNKFVQYLNNLPFVSTVYQAQDSNEMFSILSENKYKNPPINALFLDVDLGDNSLNGMDAYCMAREYGYDLPAILVTGNTIEAAHSYTIGIIDVVSKSLMFDFQRLRAALEKLANYYEYKRFVDNGKMCIPICGEKNMTVYPSEITYIESVNREIFIHTILSDEPFQSCLNLKFYEDLLYGHDFVSIHRSYLVNQRSIGKFVGEEITLKTGEILPVSRDKLVFLKQLLSKRHFFGFGF